MDTIAKNLSYFNSLVRNFPTSKQSEGGGGSLEKIANATLKLFFQAPQKPKTL